MDVKRKQGDGLWKRGAPLSEEEQELIERVKELATALGHTPIKKECSQSCKIKKRFRSWNDVIFASGLPSPNTPEQIKLRKQFYEKNNKKG